MDIYSTQGKQNIIAKHTPKSKTLKNSIKAFISGGIICSSAEGLRHLFIYLGISEDKSLILVSAFFIVLAAVLTATGIFDKIVRMTCAGLLVPITGFSNSIVSEAIDSRSEGYVLGVGSKIYTVAGPVILFGLASGVLYGIIYYVTTTVIAYIM